MKNTEGLTEAQKTDLQRRHSEDFAFMVLCASKGNMAMYQLMRDRDLDNYRGAKVDENR